MTLPPALSRARAMLGDAAFAEATRRGSAMGLRDATDYALAEIGEALTALSESDVRPEKYRERQDIVQTVQGEMKLSADWSKLSPEEAATMVRLAEKANAER